MINTAVINGKTLCYSDQGQGSVVVLLHGYLETKESWGNFSEALSQRYRVLNIDVPGHGNSQLIHEISTMEEIAIQIKGLISSLEITECFMIGHSMGGYIVLAFAELFPRLLNGICLFHSTPLADSEEKKHARAQSIMKIRHGELSQIIQSSIPQGFAHDNYTSHADVIATSIDIARKNEAKGVISLLEGMKIRPDRTHVLDSDIRKLIILGKKDNYIDYEKLVSLVENRVNTKVVTLESSGHSGFLEEPELSLSILTEFIG